MKKSILFIVFVLLLAPPLYSVKALSGLGNLVRTPESSAVYRLDGQKRYTFPDAKTYESWYGSDFSAVTVVTPEQLAQYTLSGSVTCKPGSLIKIQTDPKVYEVVDDLGKIQWVPDEATAVTRFGTTWAKLVRDVPDSFFVNYTVQEIAPASQETPPPSQDSSAEAWKAHELLALSDGNSIKNLALAFNGSGFGAVWSGKKGTLQEEIFFIPLDQAGNRLGADVRVTNHDSQTGEPVKIGSLMLLWNSDRNEYAMLWPDYHESYGHKLHFIRLNKDGQPLAEAASVSTIVATEGYVGHALVWTGQEYVVAWSKTAQYESVSNNEIYLALLGETGAGSVKIIRITNDKYDSVQPSLAWNGAVFLLTWSNGMYDAYNDIHTTVHEISYVVLYPTGLRFSDIKQLSYLSGASAENSTAFWDGTAFTIWYEGNITTDSAADGVYRARVSELGDVITSPHPVSAGAGTHRNLAVILAGNANTAFWYDESVPDTLKFAQVLSDGTIQRAETAAVTGKYYDSVSAATNGTGSFILLRWQKDPALSVDKNEYKLFFGQR